MLITRDVLFQLAVRWLVLITRDVLFQLAGRWLVLITRDVLFPVGWETVGVNN